MPKPRKKPGDPLVATAYIRVSTDDQKLGPEAQRSAVESWAAREGVRIALWCVDEGLSGGLEHEKRPGLMQAITGLQEHNAGLLVVAKRDRLARDVGVAAMIYRLVEKQGARVVSADGLNLAGPEDKLMRGIADLFAEHEREVIKSRTRAALAVKRQRGERIGGIPYGFAVGPDGKTLVENAEEQQVLARIQELRAAKLSLRKIAEQLDAESLPCRGKRWHFSRIGQLLKRGDDASPTRKRS